MFRLDLIEWVGPDVTEWPVDAQADLVAKAISQPDAGTIGVWPSGQGGVALGPIGRLRALRAGVSGEPLKVYHTVEPFFKLVTYVPESHVDVVRDAVCGAGAGHIGRYRWCTWSVPGEGTFLPEAGSKPFIGQSGRLERVAEQRFETIVPAWRRDLVEQALIDAHPYEEVAFDWLRLANQIRLPAGYQNADGWWWGEATDPLVAWAEVQRPQVVHVEKITWRRRLRLLEAGVRVDIMEPGHLLLPGLKILLTKRASLWEA